MRNCLECRARDQWAANRRPLCATGSLSNLKTCITEQRERIFSAQRVLFSKQTRAEENSGVDERTEIKGRREEAVACGDTAGLRLRVRCHSEAPGCLIFHHVIPALWIRSDCSLRTRVTRGRDRLCEFLTSELFFFCARLCDLVPPASLFPSILPSNPFDRGA